MKYPKITLAIDPELVHKLEKRPATSTSSAAPWTKDSLQLDLHSVIYVVRPGWEPIVIWSETEMKVST